MMCSIQMQYASILVLSFILHHTPGVSTPTTSVHLSSTAASTRDPQYACRGKQLVFNCEVVNGVVLQWVSEPDIPCNDPIIFTSGDDEGQRRTRNEDFYQSYLISVARRPPDSNFTSNLTFTPPESVNSVTVVCEDKHEQLSCCNTKAESTIIITDAPIVPRESLQYFISCQECYPNGISVLIQVDEIQDIAPLTYKLNLSSPDGCVLQECPTLLSPRQRSLTITLLNGVNYTATLEVSNDCGSNNITVPINPVCEPRATDPPPETPRNAAAIAVAVVGSTFGGVTVIFVAVYFCYRKKKKDLEQRRQQTEMEEENQMLKEENESITKQLQTLKEEIKRIHERTRKRSRRRRHLQGEDVPEGSPALSDSPASGSTASGGIEYPLHMAAKKGNLEKVKHLGDEGADINLKDNKKRTALHIAVERAHAKIVKYLVDREADITIKDDNGMTPLHVAAERGRCEEILGYLIAKGGDTINIKDEDGWTPLHVAVREGQESTVKFLVDSGADLTIKDNRGMTPFHAAAERGRCEKILGHLIAEGGDTCINIKDEDGRTPLHVAVEEGQECTVESLVEKFEADINNQDNDGMTPLHVAVERGDRINIMRYLLNKGVDINTTDNHGRTPIHIAAKEGHEYSVRTLVKKGADIRIKDKAGMSPRDVADESGHVNITKFLEEGRSPEDIAEFPRNINMMDGMKVWKEGGIIRMMVYEDNETMYDLQGTFEVLDGHIVGLHLHCS